MNLERRFVPSNSATVETRDDGTAKIVGYGAVFYNSDDPGTEYDLFGDGTLMERIAPGAFDRAIAEKDDARGLVNHNPDRVLGRVAAGTMRLSSDPKGLYYEIDTPDTRDAKDTIELLKRGDLDGSSFAFRVTKVTWTEEEVDGRLIDIRTIEGVRLFDVGPVTYPAYDATTSGVRSKGVRSADDLDTVLEERKLWKESLESRDEDPDKDEDKDEETEDRTDDSTDDQTDQMDTSNEKSEDEENRTDDKETDNKETDNDGGDDTEDRTDDGDDKESEDESDDDEKRDEDPMIKINHLRRKLRQSMAR